jgi:hypothetical protein
VKVVRLRAGARVIDRDAVVTEAQADALRAAGVEAVGRALDHIAKPDQDIARPELDMLLAKGFAVFFYDQFPHDVPLTPEVAKERGALFAKALDALIGAELQPGAFGDLEFNGPVSHDAGLAWARAWGEGMRAGGRPHDAYVSGIAFSATSAELDALELRSAWQSGAHPPHDPSIGYVLRQAQQTTVAGVVVDPDEAGVDARGEGLLVVVADNWTPAPARLFTFERKPDEAIGDARARCLEEALSGGAMSHTERADWYASFVNAATPAGLLAGAPVTSIAGWATSCLTVQEAVDNWLRRAAGQLTHAPVNGAGFFAVYSQAKLVKGQLPTRGDVDYYASTGTNGHVVCILGRNPDGTWQVAAGGGGDGTRCSRGTLKCDAQGFPVDPYGRPRQGHWRANEIGLPPSLPSQPEPASAATMPAQEAPTRPDLPLAPTLPPPASNAVAKPEPSRPQLRGALLSALTAFGAWVQGHPWQAALIVAALVGAVVLSVEFVHHYDRRAAG